MKKPDFTEVNEDFFEVLRRWIREKILLQNAEVIVGQILNYMSIFSYPVIRRYGEYRRCKFWISEEDVCIAYRNIFNLKLE